MKSFYSDSPFGSDISAEEVLDNIGFFDDWEERYRYIIDLGKSLPALAEEVETEGPFVRGCQGQVVFAQEYDAGDGRLYPAVDRDGLIVRGLAAMVLAALNRKSP